MDDKSQECHTANKKKKKRSRKKKKAISAQEESADYAVSAASGIEEAGPSEAGANLSSTGKLTSEEKVEKDEETSESKSLRKKKKNKKRKKSESVSIMTPEPPCDDDHDDNGMKGCEIQSDEEHSDEAEISGGVAANGCPQHGIGKVVSERNFGGLANEKSVSAQGESADNAVSAANEIEEAGPSETGPNLSSTGNLSSEEKVKKDEETSESKSLTKKKKKKKQKKSESVSITTPEPPCDDDDNGMKGCEIQSDEEHSDEAEISGGVAANGCPQHGIGKVVSERNFGGLANEVDEKKPKEDGNTEVIDSEVDSHRESDSNLKPSLADDTDVTVRCASEEDDRSCSSELAPEAANAEFAHSDDVGTDNPGEAYGSKPILEGQESDEEDISSSSFDHEG